MDQAFCPGAKRIRQPAPETFACPSCGAEVEIWTDELKGECPGCRRAVYRDAALSCLDWCRYGKECVGDAAYQQYARNRAVGIKRRLLERVRELLGQDRRRLERAERVLRFTERLLQEEPADWHIAIPAGILLGLSAGREPPAELAAFRKSLLALGLTPADGDRIHAAARRLLDPQPEGGGPAGSGPADEAVYRVLHDAAGLADWPAEGAADSGAADGAGESADRFAAGAADGAGGSCHPPAKPSSPSAADADLPSRLEALIPARFLTGTARRLARQALEAPPAGPDDPGPAS